MSSQRRNIHRFHGKIKIVNLPFFSIMRPMVYVSTKPGSIATIDREKTHIPLYKVLLHNDDVNSMDHVIKSLMRVFQFKQDVCGRIMIEAHNNGMALCIVEPLEQAEHHRDRLLSFSLIVTIEPEG